MFASFFSCLFIANPKDWSDHALWWPARNIWLTRTRSTLDQVGLHADALLHFTPMHKILRVQVSFDFFLQIFENFTYFDIFELRGKQLASLINFEYLKAVGNI